MGWVGSGSEDAVEARVITIYRETIYLPTYIHT